MSDADNQDDKPDLEAIVGAKRRGWRRLLPAWPLALALLVLGGGATAYLTYVAAGPDGERRYITQAVTRGSLTVTVTATGTIEPTDEVEISSELSGMIEEVLVDYNDRVEKGQRLARLDTDKLEAQVRHARATLMAREAAVDEARATVAEKAADFERMRQLAAKDFASQQTLDAARAAHERAKAGLASAQADVEVARADLNVDETNLAKACICSPIDGVVLDRNVDPGQYVATSLQAPVLFTLADDLRRMELQVDVDEADVGQVREGQQATFTVDAYPDRTFPARISEVRYAPETVEGVVTYTAVLSIDNSDLSLRPGMTAVADIVVRDVTDALLVPNAALRFTPPATEDNGGDDGFLEILLPRPPQFRAPSENVAANGRRTLWILKDGAPAPVTVEVGPSDGANTVIAESDIAAGQRVIVDVTAARD
ncbi:efflux RND transporter periplasmic adaptor subunit [Ferruginivarius sediminum]|uniref:Efflux RND transporter periplasmic adaptor subunit n=1 Tax=Ferruginivarius sediminum TaxID=2661937 RepID=A0A369TB01_9PROT|nr:efflux RND transporter periplasmic adaptor subunit [Ferruginivarius sediminum]RDD62458.1 efflux RND transporter periplasmic adaptor subunit [Ferruginivarius sediminum]